jgi:hypothetical protein
MSLKFEPVKCGLIVALAVFTLSCGSGASVLGGTACSSAMIGAPSDTNSSIVWGADEAGNDGKASATITAVAIECTPVEHPPVEEKGVKRSAYQDFEIAITATVVYRIQDSKWVSQRAAYSAPSDRIRFEAISEKGVVLGTGTGSFTIVGGSKENSETVSGTIANLSDGQIRLVSKVIAKWTYGR